MEQSAFVFRRHGYTEQENPDHNITVLGSGGYFIVPYAITKELIPSY